MTFSNEKRINHHELQTPRMETPVEAYVRWLHETRNRDEQHIDQRPRKDRWTAALV